jgi:hypothetical protein
MTDQKDHCRFDNWTTTLLVAIAILLDIASGTARAQTTIASFDFTGHNNTTQPWASNIFDPNLNAAPQLSTVGPNMALQSRSNSFLGNNWPTASAPVATQDYFTFTVTPKPGFGITLSGMTADVAIANQGPASFVVRTSLDNFATNVASPFTPQVNTPTQDSINASPCVSGLGLQSQPITTPIEFRLYGYGAAATNKQLWLDSSSTLGTVGLSLTGTVSPVPEPSGLGLVFGTLVVGLASGRSWLWRKTGCVASV